MKTNLSYLIRAAAGESSTLPVIIIPVDSLPTLRGRSFGWERISGPNAVERVSKSYTQKGWRNVQYAPSTRHIECGENSATRLEREFSNPPKGMGVRLHNYGLEYTRLSDGMEYHCGAEVLLERGWRGDVRRAMAENYIARQAAARLARQQASEEALFRRSLHNTRVTLMDSRKAGNCIEGSLQFAEKKLGISRQEILDAGYLFSVAADRLLKVANGDRPRVEAAIRVAYARETMVSI